MNMNDAENIARNLQRGKAGPAAQRYAQEANMSPNNMRVPKLKLNNGRGSAASSQKQQPTGVRLKVQKTSLADSANNRSR